MEQASKARFLLSAFLGQEGGGVEVAGVNYKQVKSPHQGDIFFSRETAVTVKKKLWDQVLNESSKFITCMFVAQ